MPKSRNAENKPNSKYGKFSEIDMEAACLAVENKEMKQSEAARTWNLNQQTLSYRLGCRKSGIKVLKPGPPPTFSKLEEEALLQYVLRMGEWGFPVTTFDLRSFAKLYLDRKGVQVKKFKNNFPGWEWAQSFLKRHKSRISQRSAANISRKRAAVSPEQINQYFDNLEVSIEGIPPENIINLDETNMVDDPGKKTVLARRGQKYVTTVQNSTKSAVSIMFSGTGSGVLLPPYVVYKAVHLYDQWLIGGPKGSPCCADPCCKSGTRFNRSLSGWFDATCFEDFIRTIIVPHCSRLQGKKVIIMDNLASHFTEESIRLCDAHNISFVALPPNATHIAQPLDVSFFSPLKRSWRKALYDWKVKNPRAPTIPKNQFPTVLKSCLDHMGLEKISQDLQSGFSGAGICPLDRQQVLKRIVPVRDDEEVQSEISLNISQTIEEVLHPLRFTPAGTRQRKKRMLVTAGKSISCADIMEQEGSDQESGGEDSEEVSNENSNVSRLIGAPPSFNPPSQMNKKSRKRQKPAEEEENAEEYIEKVSVSECQASDFVVAVYGDFWWIGRVEEVIEDEEQEEPELKVNFMEPHGPKTSFHWPEKPDVCIVPESNLLGKMKNHPVPRGLRNFYISAAASEQAEDLFINSVTGTI